MEKHQQSDKILTDPEKLHRLLLRLKFFKKKIVFTNGCFDLLHIGHVDYLEQAAALGDILFVGVNTDASIQALKGPERPIQPELSRYRVLAALAAVDFVVPFSEETPLDLIRKILPDVLVKGDDYQAEQIVGYSEVTNAGGKVITIPLVKGFSSSQIIEKIKKGV